jgi:multidrug transporter EmrE-like cation transporter
MSGWWQKHAFLALYIVFTVASQLIMRWRIGAPGSAAGDVDRIGFVLGLLAMPWVWIAFACTFLAGVMWMLTLSQLELTYAFPFTGITFAVILLAGAFVFGEHVGLARIAGTALVLIGLIVIVRSA